jgi:hypothetical protein
MVIICGQFNVMFLVHCYSQHVASRSPNLVHGLPHLRVSRFPLCTFTLWLIPSQIYQTYHQFYAIPVLFILFQIYHTRSRIAILIVSLYHEGPYYILSIMSLHFYFYCHHSFLHYLIKVVKFIGFVVQRGIIGKAYTSASCLMLQPIWPWFIVSFGHALQA